ncbi:MAG: molybdenum cofactor guanylyltransferase, partial [Stomatobaculum sp.]|nr:molybdenum cofactor guanylyltransferase [Stomatobaculum sp.]
MNKDAGMNKDVCAVILAGGKSSRMGRDKASLTLGHETFLQRIAAELDACGFQEKYVSLGSGSRYGMHEEENSTGTGEKTEIHIPVGWTAVRDRYRDCGPLGGIHAALSACRAEWALFVSCDTPL